MGKRKKLSVRLIERDSDEGVIYQLLDELVAEHHPEVQDARMALAWNLAWKPDGYGRVKLGMCKKASDLDKELAPYDFVILLNKDFWQDERVTEVQRKALLDHELCHADVAEDEHGEPLLDTKGRKVYCIRPHDLEEFGCIVERYGLWKKDVEAFAKSISRAPEQESLPMGDDRVTISAPGMAPVETSLQGIRDAASRLGRSE